MTRFDHLKEMDIEEVSDFMTAFLIDAMDSVGLPVTQSFIDLNRESIYEFLLGPFVDPKMIVS